MAALAVAYGWLLPMDTPLGLVNESYRAAVCMKLTLPWWILFLRPF